MIINSKFAYVKKKETFEPLITTIPKGLNPIVFIEDTREMWTCGTYFSIGYPSIEISESSGSVKVSIGNSFFLLSTAGESISVRKGDGNRIIISSNALNRVDTEAPLTWDTANRKLLHMDSGVAPGSYGQSTNLGNASVFIVPNIMIDSTGHITYAQNYNVEIRDYVEQLAPSTLAGNRNVLLSYNADSESMDTSQVRKANGLLFNDSTQRLTVEGGLDTNGPVFVNHGDLSVLDGYIIGHLKGDVEGEAKPKIHLSNKPEYGGASINLYGHVKLQDILNNKPEPSSDNENINDANVVNAIAASPLMVWNAIQTAKDYADSILGSNNAMLYKGSIEAGITYPGTYTPIGQIGNTYVVTFGSGNYIDSVGYVNGEPVEVGDLIICKEETPAATSTTWETVKSKWTYVQTNNTGVVSGPSSSTIGQLAVFNNTKGKLIKGLPNGNVGQILSIDESGIPAWVNKPDRLNFALSFQVRGTEFVAFDGYEPKKVNFIAGDNMFITSDMQGNLTLAADPGSDTVNTAGATNNPNTKLFLIGAESQTTAPQTYSNQYVYIGPDNKLYSDGKEVSTTDHTHNYAGAKTPGGPALKIDLNPDGLLDAEYGTYGGIIQDSNNGPTSGSWSNRIKILHNNSSGYYTELAQNLTGTAGVWHRRNVAGVISEWIPLLDKSNFHTYLDETYIQKQTDPNQLKNFVRYSLESGLTINWTAGNVTPTQVIGFKENNSAQAYTFNGDNIRAFANAVNRSGDTMSGNLTTTGIILTTTTGITHNGKSSALLYCDGTNSFVGMSAATTYIRSGNTDLFHKKNGTDYKIWDASNDGSGSGLDADLLDGVHLMQKGSTAGVMRSWARGTHTTVNQYFGNGVVVVIDPKPTDSNDLWANTTIFSVGDSSIRNWQMAFGYGADVIKVRKNNDSWGSWKTLAFLDSKVASSTNSDYPTGFSSRSTSSTWGNTTGTHITGWHTSTGGDIAFMNDNPSAGKVSIKIDGLFYQDEGRYKVLDTNNYPSTLDSRYLLKGSAVNTSNNSSWLSFANNAGGVGGTMGVNDQWRIYGRSTADNAGYLEIATADDGNEPIYFRQYSGVFTTLKRTLTLLDGNGNTSMPGNLTVTNATTSGSFNTSGKYNSTFASGTWINSVSNSALTLSISSYGGIWCAPTKGGRVTMSVHPSSNNNVYIGYASSAQITAGTNAFTKQTYWNADNGFWTSGGYAKENSSDSYVLLGGGGHATLSGLGGSHTHTVLRNNLMIKGTNGISDSASIHLGIGDSDTGFKWVSDGVCQIYANNKAIGQWNSGGMNWYYTPQVNGVAVSLSNHTHTYIVSSGLRSATANGNTRGESGVRLYSCYSNSYPISFGAVLHLHEGRGAAELLLGWSGTDGAHAENYIRSKRDNDSGAWSGWAKIWTSANLDVSTYFKYQGNNVNADWNKITTTGNMRVTEQTITNGPSGAYNYGQLLTFNAGGTLSQIYLPHSAYGSMYIRTGWSGVSQYYGWVQVLTTGNYTSLIGNSFIKKAGDTMTGALNFANNVWNKVGDDVYIGDHNQANYLCVKANSGSTVGINFFNSSNGDVGKLASVNGTLQWKGTNISLNGHTHNYIVSRGNLNAQTGRTQSLGDVYSYNTVSGNKGGPTTYTSVIGFGRGAAGTVEIAGGWTSGMGLWYRALRDTTDNWFGWVKVWDSKNFNPDTKFNTSGGTISGAVTINNTLSVKSIKSTTTYSSNYVFCADGSIRNFPTLFSTNILWASYKVYTGGSGSYSRLSGNYNFITGRTREGTGRLVVTISVPSGYSKTQIMMFATGHHQGSNWTFPIYASIQPDYGNSSSVRIMTADDDSHNDAECIVNFILVKTS